jgi:hypothetical protein
MNKIYPIDERLFMKKLLIIYLIISFLMVFVYAIFVVNAYVSIKYEVETIDNDAIINMVYQIFDTGVIVNFIGLVINMLIIGGLYMKFRSKHE